MRSAANRCWMEFCVFALATVLAALPCNAQQLDREASRLYADREFAAAADLIEKHLHLQPDDDSARLLLGLSLQQSGQLDRAEAVFQEAVRRARNEHPPRFHLARVHYLVGKLAEAEADARLSLELGAEPARVHQLLGKIAEERRLPESALESYRAAIAAAQDASIVSLEASGRLAAGSLLLQLRRAAEAVEQLEKALGLQPDLPEGRYHLGRAYLASGQLKRAVAVLAEAARRDDHPLAGSLLARVRSAAKTGLDPRSEPAPRSEPRGAIAFAEVAAEAGLVFILAHHPTPQKYLPETMAGGVAVFDYDGDGRIDVFFTNGAETPSLEKTSSKYSNRLFRNEGEMRFRDVTEAAGLAGAGFSIGAAAADYDNDGHVDLFVAGVRGNRLYLNLGDGRFADVTERSGISSPNWSSAAGWLDYDNNGLLDLFVVNYLQWSPDDNPYCGNPTAKVRTYCHPKHFQPLPNTLYHNLGDGRFEDVSASSGVAVHGGKGMSLAIADYDADGFVDVFVTNDQLPNFLFHNRGGLGFEEVAHAAGAALTEHGQTVSGMGADFRDFDNDARPDIVLTALTGETFPLFRNQGEGFFFDATYPSRAGLLTGLLSGWAVGFVDLDNDGWKDLFLANSHVMDNVADFSEDRYEQANRVLRNQADGTFADVSAEAGAAFGAQRAHRGAAWADFDGDGRLDAVVAVLGGRAELWRNVTQHAGNWVRFKLQGTASNRDAIGAEIRVGNQLNHMTSAVGYASSTHAGVHFGLGADAVLGPVEIRWPSGLRETLHEVPINQVVPIREGAGEVTAAPGSE